MTNLTTLVHQFTHQYRAALLTRASVLAALSLGIVGIALWRLSRIGALSPWSIGACATLTVAGLTALAWWLCRRWVSDRTAAAHLDRMLALDQRLITANEFAHVPQPPALYALLLEDIRQRYAADAIRLPRPVNRSTGVLAAILLLFLLWPHQGEAPMRLSQLPVTPPTLAPSTPEPSPSPDRQHEDQRNAQQGGDNQPTPASSSSTAGSSPDRGSSPDQSQQGSTGQTPAGHAEGGGSQENRPFDSGSELARGAPQAHAGQSQGRGEGNQSSSSGQPQDASRSPSQQSAAAGASSGLSPEQQRQVADRAQELNQQTQGAPADRAQQGSATPQQGGGAQRTAKGNGPQQSLQQGGRAQATGAGEGSERSSGPPRDQRRQTDLAQAQAQHSGESGSPGASSSGNQEMLKAQIQELLKEVSGEVKQLQAQLASAKELPTSEAGTSTDPNLYDAASQLERATGGPLAVQLQTDTAPTAASRPGGGTGQPSGTVDSATPQIATQDAQLADRPAEETPAARQPIPPEYRNVFDQLNRHPSTGPQPSETPHD